MAVVMILRHAKAVSAGTGMRDFDRPLAERGVLQAGLVGRHLIEQDFLPDAILCSSALRTRQTLEHSGLMDRIPAQAVTFSDALFSTDTAGYRDAVADAAPARRLLLIGHNPMAGEVARILSGSGDRDQIRRLENGFPTAALAVIHFEDSLEEARHRRGRLEHVFIAAA